MILLNIQYCQFICKIPIFTLESPRKSLISGKVQYAYKVHFLYLFLIFFSVISERKGEKGKRRKWGEVSIFRQFSKTDFCFHLVPMEKGEDYIGSENSVLEIIKTQYFYF